MDYKTVHQTAVLDLTYYFSIRKFLDYSARAWSCCTYLTLHPCLCSQFSCYWIVVRVQLKWKQKDLHIPGMEVDRFFIVGSRTMVRTPQLLANINRRVNEYWIEYVFLQKRVVCKGANQLVFLPPYQGSFPIRNSIWSLSFIYRNNNGVWPCAALLLQLYIQMQF